MVENGLAIASEKCELSPWTADELRESLEAERAALYRHEAGFVILAQPTDIVTGRKFLCAILAWFVPAQGVKAMHDVLAWLDAMKAANACSRIEFWSPRAGWSILEPHFAPYLTAWRRA